MEPKAKILYVDDEQVNLSNFKQLFGGDYEIFTAADGDDGLRILADAGEMAVVLSDQRMPGMSGIDLLSAVRESCPDSVRILVTAYTETQDLLDSINRGHIYKYVVKPWEIDSLRMTLKNAVDHYRLTARNKKLMAELVELNSGLEQRVRERTRELHKANSSLERSNEQLSLAHQQVQTQSTQLEQMNGELNEKVNELEKALADVKVLRGLLPICSYCKKIRDDHNYWQDLETYIRRHADISFTHGICPECYAQHVKSDLEAFRQKIQRQQQAGKNSDG
ncbi:MAG: response regulator [Deltaproteobacteria bacterium]